MTPQTDRRSGIATLDQLWAGASPTHLQPGGDRAAIGAVQELLAGHGASELPGPLSPV